MLIKLLLASQILLHKVSEIFDFRLVFRFRLAKYLLEA